MSTATTQTADLIERNSKNMIPVYGRTDIVFVQGAGCVLHDAEGRRVLDFFSSILCTNLGHCHPAVTAAITHQAAKLVHVSNLHHSEPQARLAELLVAHSFAEKIFLCNSGAEANEAAIKLARRRGNASGGRFEILTTLGSFHGRTMATIAATGQEKIRVGYEPNLQGFRYVPFGDLDAMRAAVGPTTGAILVEPIQGEGGVIVPPADYLPGLRELCDDEDLLLIFDEIQTGCGRTGTLFAYESMHAVPDVMTLAKGIANGLPVGALCVGPRAAEAFDQGSHGSTFGGNCVTNAAAVATLEILLDGATLPRARLAAQRLRAGLEALAKRHPKLVTEVRGRGLLLGMQLEGADTARAIAERALAAGLLINVTGQGVLRIAPPLIISDKEIDEGLDLLEGAFPQ
ncbi:MAG: aspartate aminotransferase family protein [Deltaproteobacteria bacterium]